MNNYNIDAYKLYCVFQSHGMTSSHPIDYKKLVADILEAIKSEERKELICSICNKSTRLTDSEYLIAGNHLDCVFKNKNVNYETECDEQKQSRI